MEDAKIETMTLSSMAQPGPNPGARFEFAARRQTPGDQGFANRARPGPASTSNVGPIFCGPTIHRGSSRCRCSVVWVAVEGEGLDDPGFKCSLLHTLNQILD